MYNNLRFKPIEIDGIKLTDGTLWLDGKPWTQHVNSITVGQWFLSTFEKQYCILRLEFARFKYLKWIAVGQKVVINEININFWQYVAGRQTGHCMVENKIRVDALNIYQLIDLNYIKQYFNAHKSTSIFYVLSLNFEKGPTLMRT